jgi:hypothetical protein
MSVKNTVIICDNVKHVREVEPGAIVTVPPEEGSAISPQQQYSLLHSVTVKCGATVGNGLPSVVVTAIRLAQRNSRRNRRVPAPSRPISTAHTLQCYNTDFHSCHHRTHTAVLQYRLSVQSAPHTPCSVTIPPFSPVSTAHTLECYKTAFQSCQHSTHPAVLQYRLSFLSAPHTQIGRAHV